MSGGAFNYLCWRLAHGLFEDYLLDLQEMATHVRDNPDYSEKVSEIIDDYYQYACNEQTGIEARHEKLSDLMKAVEWCASADWGPEEANKIAEELEPIETTDWEAVARALAEAVYDLEHESAPDIMCHDSPEEILEVYKGKT